MIKDEGMICEDLAGKTGNLYINFVIDFPNMIAADHISTIQSIMPFTPATKDKKKEIQIMPADKTNFSTNKQQQQQQQQQQQRQQQQHHSGHGQSQNQSVECQNCIM